MTPRTHRGLSRLLAFFLLIGTTSAPAQLFESRVTLDPRDPSLNHLTIQSSASSGASRLAFESTGAVLSDRIELRAPAHLEFSAHALPQNWQWQTVVLDESGTLVRIITFFFVGNDSGNAAEFFDFATPWQVAFRLTDPSAQGPGPTANTTALAVEVNASSVIPGLGIIPVSSSSSLAASLTNPATQVPFSFCAEDGDPSGPTLRFTTALPGINYCVESTETLESWNKRTDFSTGVALIDHLVPLSGGWKQHEFFRLLLIPLPPSG